MAVPKFLQSALWSADVRKIDLRRDQDYLITQVLNHGTWEQVRWLLRTYPAAYIRRAVARPTRGIWEDDALHYWMTVLNVKLSPKTRARGLRSLSPRSFPRDYA